ncbi:MAG: restriction endonuclease subunit S, partial [Anaerobutyricum soehngenii]
DNLPYEKVGKNEPVCIADEVPFDIPESWEWVRLGEIFQHNTGKALNSSNKSGVLLEYITTSNLYWDRFELENLRSMYFTENEIEKCQVSKGDLLVCEGGDIGRAAIWLKDYKICIQNHIHRLRSYVPLCTRFYYYVFFLYKYAGWIGGKGIGIQGLSSNALHSLLVPVPPIAEQERIVKRLEIIKPLSDKYSEASEQIQELNNLFPEHLKKSILQYAVQGKLVPQDPADEPASVLLERIRTEKEKLIKAGKIKRDKHESVIFRRDNSYYEKVDGIERCIDDELPFEIPDSWEWTTIGTTCINIQYGSSRKSESTGTMAVLRMGNIQNGRIDTQKLVYTSDKEEIAHYPLEYNDLLFNRTNSKELVGKTAIYKSEVPAIYAGYLIRITPLIDSDYLNYVMQTQFYWVYCQNVRSDAIGQSNINAEKLKNFIYPLPPLHEQKRIAKKLNSIFTKIK